MEEKLANSKNLEFIEPSIRIVSSMTDENKKQIDVLADELMKPSKHLAGERKVEAPKAKHHFACKICGFVVEYEGEELPKDFVCPICKHPASDFEKID